MTASRTRRRGNHTDRRGRRNWRGGGGNWRASRRICSPPPSFLCRATVVVFFFFPSSLPPPSPLLPLLEPECCRCVFWSSYVIFRLLPPSPVTELWFVFNVFEVDESSSVPWNNEETRAEHFLSRTTTRLQIYFFFVSNSKRQYRNAPDLEILIRQIMTLIFNPTISFRIWRQTPSACVPCLRPRRRVRAVFNTNTNIILNNYLYFEFCRARPGSTLATSGTHTDTICHCEIRTVFRTYPRRRRVVYAAKPCNRQNRPLDR